MEIKDVFEITILFVAVICFFMWILFVLHSIKLSNRVKSQSIKLTDNRKESYIDRLMEWYLLEKRKISNKYIDDNSRNSLKKKKLESAIDKIFCMLIVLILYLCLSLFYLRIPNLEAIIVSMMIGYLLPTFKEIIKKEYDKKFIERDLLNAVSLINNNLQSGKTIREAIVVTTKKLDGPLKLEFEEVINDLEHGLSIQVAFDRMKNRTNNDDISYLTTLLSIISKTGGNIVEMFEYIENLFQTRNNLNLELKATIASSKLVFIILSILPVVVFIGMSFIYDGFISLFICNPLGLLVGLVIMLLYLIYIIVIRRIIRIEKY